MYVGPFRKLVPVEVEQYIIHVVGADGLEEEIVIDNTVNEDVDSNSDEDVDMTINEVNEISSAGNEGT